MFTIARFRENNAGTPATTLHPYEHLRSGPDRALEIGHQRKIPRVARPMPDRHVVRLSIPSNAVARCVMSGRFTDSHSTGGK